MGQGNPGQAGDLRIGVVLEAFLDWPLNRVLSWMPGAAPEITHLEVGAACPPPSPTGASFAAMGEDQRGNL